MIISFRNKITARIYDGQEVLSFNSYIQQSILRKLRMLNRAKSLIDLQILPGNRLEKLGGSRKGQYSIRVNNQYRICFSWFNNNCYEVEVVDYH